MSEDQAQPIELDLFEALPAELDVGAPFSLAVALTTKSGCDLAGAAYKVLQGEEAVAAGVLPPIVRFDPDSSDYDPRNGPVDKRDNVRIALCAPREIGAFQWTLVLPEQELGGVALAEAALTFSFSTGEHRTSLAAWDVPSPVVAGEKFSVKVGAKCTACCALNGRQVELRDEKGGVLAVGHLGETVWPGTEGLYWTELEATAPGYEGLHNCSVAFSACDHALPHQGASAALSFATVAPGRHRICVAIVERETKAPIPRSAGAARLLSNRERRSGHRAVHGATRQTQAVRLEGGFLSARAEWSTWSTTSISSSKPRLCRKRIPMRAGRANAGRCMRSESTSSSATALQATRRHAGLILHYPGRQFR